MTIGRNEMYQSTLTDLDLCYTEMVFDPPSDQAAKAQKALIELCVDIALEFGEEANMAYTLKALN